MTASHRIASAFFLSLVLGGCAATVKKSEDASPIRIGADASRSIALFITGSPTATHSTDWEPFRELWRAALKDEAAAMGAAFTAADGDATPTGAPGTLLAVEIVDFRLISAGARIGFGVMTGNAFVNARVTYRDLKTGEVWGQRYYDTSSTAWQGIFAPMTDKQVRAICKEIGATLSAR